MFCCGASNVASSQHETGLIRRLIGVTDWADSDPGTGPRAPRRQRRRPPAADGARLASHRDRLNPKGRCAMATIASGHLEALRQAVHGRVLLPGDDGYDVARTVWNATVDRRPAIIVQCSGTTDVVHAVNFARDRGLVLAVRGGGHNIAGSAICNDGLVIDMSMLRVVSIEQPDRVAWVCPAATLADFDHEAQG